MKVFKYLIFSLAYFFSSLLAAEQMTTAMAGVIFDDTGYAGDQLEIRGDIADLGELDRAMSSFLLFKNYSVRFYEKKNFEGGYYTVTTTDENRMKSLMRLINNKIRSVRVLSWPSYVPHAMEVWENADFTGKSTKIYMDNGFTSFDGTFGSYRVEPDFEVELHTEPFYQGSMYRRYGGLDTNGDEADPDIEGNTILSIKITKRPIIYLPDPEPLPDPDTETGSGSTGSGQDTNEGTYESDFPDSEVQVEIYKDPSSGLVLVKTNKEFIELSNPIYTTYPSVKLSQSYPELSEKWWAPETRYNIEPCFKVRFYTTTNFAGVSYDVPSENIPSSGVFSDFSEGRIMSMKIIGIPTTKTQYVTPYTNVLRRNTEDKCWTSELKDF